MKKIAVIGLGYVGLPLAVLLSRAYHVVGVDVNERRVSDLNRGICFIDEEDFRQEFRSSHVRQNFSARKSPEEADVFIIAVPTPVTSGKKPDLSYVDSALESILPFLKNGSLVIIESTVPPLTAAAARKTIEEKAQLNVPEDVLLAHCPERVLPGNTLHELVSNSRIVGGVDRASTEAAAEIYSSFTKGEIVKTDATTAEFCKLMENAFRDVNIAFANELGLMAEQLGISIKEAISIANRHPRVSIHSPGIGVGGHCFDENHFVFVRHPVTGVSAIKLKELFKHYYPYDAAHLTPLKLFGKMVGSRSGQASLPMLIKRDRNVLLFPENLQVLSFDLSKNETSFRKAIALSRRASRSLLSIDAHYGHSLKVTDKHPVVVYQNGSLSVKMASELLEGESLVFSRSIPSLDVPKSIDIIDSLMEHASELICRVRVRPLVGHVRDFDTQLRAVVAALKLHDFYRYNYLPLSVFLKIENNISLSRENIVLLTGRGPSLNEMPAIIRIDGRFSRLTGYYLSEGCITAEKKTARVRFTFNGGEHEYVNDLCGILKGFGIKYSAWKDPRWDNIHIKVSSYLLALLMSETLVTGRNCYDMQIPKEIFFSTSEHRLEVLKGILRGDGGVSYYNQKRSYLKNGKRYLHANNSIDICYFTSSQQLLEQVKLILLELGVLFSIERKKGLISITGHENAEKLKSVFLGEKASKIESYLSNSAKRISYPFSCLHSGFIAVKVKRITEVPAEFVYSLEVDATNTLLTNSGLVAHNCIPIDPWFLVEADKKHTTLIQASRKVNDAMPRITAEKIIDAVKSVQNPKIVTIGLSYKPNVGDLRESPAIEIVKILREKGCEVADYDPLIEGKKYDSLATAAKGADCLAILVEHAAVKKELEESIDQIKSAMKTPILVRF